MAKTSGKKLDVNDLAQLFGSKDTAEEAKEGPKVGMGARDPSNRSRKGALERSEEYRMEGNRLFGMQCYEDAVGMYTRACNASPMDYRGYSNRCASYTALGKYKEALADANQALTLESKVAKVWGRKALAHACLKENHEAVKAYNVAVELDAGNETYAKALQRAKEDAAKEASTRVKEFPTAQRKQTATHQGGMFESKHVVPSRASTKPNSVWQRGSAKTYEQDLADTKASRRSAIAKWKFSVGREEHEEGPTFDRDSSPSVDAFSVLRGRCTNCTRCTMWWREVESCSGWNDLSMLTCQTCGCSNDSHENCGMYMFHDPVKPQSTSHAGGSYTSDIPGIHSFQ